MYTQTINSTHTYRNPTVSCLVTSFSRSIPRVGVKAFPFAFSPVPSLKSINLAKLDSDGWINKSLTDRSRYSVSRIFANNFEASNECLQNILSWKQCSIPFLRITYATLSKVPLESKRYMHILTLKTYPPRSKKLSCTSIALS